MTSLSKTPADEWRRTLRHPSKRRATLDVITTALEANGHRDLNRARADLRRIDPEFDQAVARMMDARPGLPGAASYDSPAVSGGSWTSPQERLAILNDAKARKARDSKKGKKDKQRDVATDIITMDRALRRMLADCTLLATGDTDTRTMKRLGSDAATLWRLVVAWTPRPATSKQRAEVERANAGDPECTVTRDVLNIFEPAYCTSDLRGLLPEPMPVGRWVRDRANALGRLPTPNEMRRWASAKDAARSRLIAAGTTP